ncbi:hypothetical protein VTJ04DRAFT_1982 [Mycothermus thermophilus]|uniref:uncharacterized protein n=1 Tax=Humicola insolens TaxID=85995 RepID=UPI0037445EB9
MFRAILNVAFLVGTAFLIHRAIVDFAGRDIYLYRFLALFAWRYIRFFINFIAFWCYKPSPKPRKPRFQPQRDVTCIIPTVDPEGAGFRETLTAVAANRPAKLIVVTVGDVLYKKAEPIIQEFKEANKDIEYVLLQVSQANKRVQVAHAVPQVNTPITVLLDDHVYFGPQFLESMLYPFEDHWVGLVGTNKRVRRKQGTDLRGSIWNMLGAIYLYRHNFEIRATNTIDGGVFVVSGRSCAIRSEILQRKDFLKGYTNERFFFGLFGPLNADDDNYITRYVVRDGWDIKIQYTEATVMETDIGVEEPLEKKFLGQCLRWVRTTWRSNSCSLFTDRTVWSRQPYCVYAVYLTSFTNFALFTDAALLYFFVRSSWLSLAGLLKLLLWIFFTKTVKVFDYYRCNPRDIYLFPVQVAFAYFHSLIKLYALLTFYSTDWSGRQLDKLTVNVKANGTTLDVEAGKESLPPSPTDEDRFRPTAYESAQHPHIALVRNLTRTTLNLRARQSAHIKSYQKALLEELPKLRAELEKLLTENQVVIANNEQIAELVTAVADLIKDVLGKTKDIEGEKEGELGKSILGLKKTVEDIEARWAAG